MYYYYEYGANLQKKGEPTFSYSHFECNCRCYHYNTQVRSRNDMSRVVSRVVHFLLRICYLLVLFFYTSTYIVCKG